MDGNSLLDDDTDSDIDGDADADADALAASKVVGTQTLVRGLALLECVADGISNVKGISTHLGTRRSTTHRMLSSLVAEGYLHHVPHRGYTLGPQLIRLGARALEQRPIAGIARRQIEDLARRTSDTVHLGVLDGATVLYLDKIPGTRGLEMRSRIGQQMPLALTGLGKALMFGLPRERWHPLYEEALGLASRDARPLSWLDYEVQLLEALERGWAYDLEENELGIRCVAAPVRDISGGIVAAISISSPIFYMAEARMRDLGPVIRATADAISRDLGWES